MNETGTDTHGWEATREYGSSPRSAKIVDKVKDVDYQLVVLSGLKIGMWSSREHEALWLLVLRTKSLFVFIVEPLNVNSQKVRNIRFPTKTALLRLTGAASPFDRSRKDRDRHAVIAFEVSWNNISGVSYEHPLVQPGRFVIESHYVKKCEFTSLSNALEYYTRANHELGNRGVLQNEHTMDLDSKTPAVSKLQTFQLNVDDVDGTYKNKEVHLNGSSKVRRDLMKSLQVENSESLDVSCSFNRKNSIAGAAEVDRKATGDIRKGSTINRFRLPFRRRRRTQSISLENDEISNSSLDVMSDNLTSTNIEDESGNEHSNRKSDMSSRSYMELSLADMPEPNSPPLDPENSLSNSGNIPFTDKDNEVFEFRLISVCWEDPRLPTILRPCIEGNERLLRMYESGLPSWAVFLPQYGLPYRPYMRKITWFLFYLWSVISLALGFYDLYKCLPGLQELLDRFASTISLPVSAILGWIETHTKVRLSILLTYLFGKSPIFTYLAHIVGSAIQTLHQVTLAPLTNAFVQAANKIVLPIFTALSSALLSPLAFVLAFIKYLWSLLISLFFPLLYLLREATSIALSTNAAASTVGSSSSAPWSLWIPAAASWRAAKELVLRVSRSLQAVFKFVVATSSATMRHRMTLSRQARRRWYSAKEWSNSKMIGMNESLKNVFSDLLRSVGKTRKHNEKKSGDINRFSRRSSESVGSCSNGDEELSSNDISCSTYANNDNPPNNKTGANLIIGHSKTE